MSRDEVRLIQLALSATFENDFKQLENVNRLVTAQLDEKHRHVRCRVIIPSRETGLLRIIRYEPEASRELIDLGYADARRVLARMERAISNAETQRRRDS